MNNPNLNFMTMSDIHTKNKDINVSPEKMEEIKIEISSYLENLSNSTLKHLEEKKTRRK